jgi:hypothetical protein
MSKFVGTGPSSYEKRIYWAAVSQRLRQTSKKSNKYQLLNTYSCTSWWWAQIRQKQVEIDKIY